MPFDAPPPAVPRKPSPEYERDAILWTRWKSGDDRALAALLGYCEPLVTTAARRAARQMPGADLDDLRQTARLALLVCARAWDPAAGVTLAGYARSTVMHAALHGLRDQQPTGQPLDEMSDTVPADSIVPADRLDADSLTASAARAALDEAMDQLPERTRAIVQARRLCDPPVTLDTLARRYGVSVARIWRIDAEGWRRVVATVSELLSLTRGGHE